MFIRFLKDNWRLALVTGVGAVACVALLAYRSAGLDNGRYEPPSAATSVTAVMTVNSAPAQPSSLPDDEAAASQPQSGVVECPGLKLPAVKDWATYRAASGDFSFRYPGEFKVHEDIYRTPGAYVPPFVGKLSHAIALGGLQPLDTNGLILNIGLSLQVSVFRGEVNVADSDFSLALVDEGDVAAGHYKVYRMSEMDRGLVDDQPFQEINLYTPTGWTIAVFDSFGISCREGSPMEKSILEMMMEIASSFHSN